MRVIAGSLRGRRLVTPPHTDTRPTADRVREALFSSIAARPDAYLSATRVLDAFAGSGALGIEALSRGAAQVTFVERDRAALAALRRNVDDLELGCCTQIICGDVFRMVRSGRLGPQPYSLLFLDPPYRINKAEVTALVGECAARGLIARDNLIVWEHGAGENAVWPEAFELDSVKRYGSTVVEFARWTGEEGDR